MELYVILSKINLSQSYSLVYQSMMQPTYLTTEMCACKHQEKRTEDAEYTYLLVINKLLPFYKPERFNLEVAPI